MHRLTRPVMIVLFLTALPLTTFVQAQSSTTSLRGTVSDPQGAVLPDTPVTLSSPATGFSRIEKDRPRWRLSIPAASSWNLYPHRKQARRRPYVKKNPLQLLVNIPATSNLSMRVKGEVNVVDVTSTGVQVNSQDATIGNAFGTTQIAALPFRRA